MTVMRCLALLLVLAGLAASPAVAAEMTKAQEAAMVAIFKESQAGSRLFSAGRFAEAEATFRGVLARTDSAFPGEDLMRASALHNLAATLAEMGRLREAEAMATEALQLRESNRAKVGSMAIGSSQALLASILRTLGRRSEGNALMRSAFLVVAGDPQGDPELLVENAGKLVGVLAEDGQIAEAERLAADLLKWAPRLPDDLKVDTFWSVARVRSATGAFGAAETLYRQAYDLILTARPDDLTRQAILVANIASMLRQQFRPREAEALFRRAATDLEALYPDGHPALANALDGLALSMTEQGRPGEAWSIARRALDMRLATLPDDHPLIATSLVNLGLALFHDGQFGVARDSFQSAVDRRQKAGDEPGAARAAVSLAAAQAALGDNPGSIRSLEAARGVLEASLPAGHPLVTTAAINEAWALLAEGEAVRALAVARQAAVAITAARAVADGGLDAVPPDEDKRRIVVAVAAAWDVAAGR